jgi:broad specificity phosphatase PhoE
MKVEKVRSIYGMNVYYKNDPKLILIRHGESDANTKHLLGRVSHSPLSERGTREAALLGQHFHDVGM